MDGFDTDTAMVAYGEFINIAGTATGNTVHMYTKDMWNKVSNAGVNPQIAYPYILEANNHGKGTAARLFTNYLKEEAQWMFGNMPESKLKPLRQGYNAFMRESQVMDNEEATEKTCNWIKEGHEMTYANQLYNADTLVFWASALRMHLAVLYICSSDTFHEEMESIWKDVTAALNAVLASSQRELPLIP